MPATASASGLGKIGLPEPSPTSPCSSPPDIDPRDDFRWAIGGGVMNGSWPDGSGSRGAMAAEAGIRLLSTQVGCEQTLGIFGGKRYVDHSLLTFADAELPFSHPTSTFVGAKLAWNVRWLSTGLLSQLNHVMGPQLMFGAGPGLMDGKFALGLTAHAQLLLTLRLSMNIVPGGEERFGVHLLLTDFDRLFSTSG